MTIKKQQKLELTWIGKGEEPALEPRILIENPEYSCGDPDTENMLIHGDNLLALKALEQNYTGKVKCIYIDPPYNTGNAFDHYDDGLEHSIWLDLMYQRLVILRNLLSDEGSIWVTLDDNESHYCKVICDEVFGRKNFITNVIWEKSDSPRMDAKYFSTRHDHILVYSKSKEKLSLNKDKDFDLPSHYDKRDENGIAYYLKPLRAMGGEDTRADRPSMFFELTAPDGEKILPKRQDGSDGRWRWGIDKVEEEKGRLEWVKGRKGWSIYYRIYASNEGRPPETIFPHSKVGSNRTSKAEIKAVFGKKTFDTPKPEALIKKVIELSSNKGDIVLDSFLGSGTTCAVAQKMSRKFIGIEMGDHAYSHCYKRQKMVTDGADKGGITEVVKWQGGGGFKFYELAPSLLNKDQYDNWVISKKYNANMLAAAMAKQEGFSYQPEKDSYWKQGFSSEQDFIYTTTQFVTVELLDQLNDQLKEGESLLICAKKFQPECNHRFGNITLKKIPQMLLGKCEFAKDDYSLKIINLPKEDEINETEEDLDNE